MTEVRLAGRLVCATDAQAQAVAAQLPLHVTLTQAEPGCVDFRIAATEDPLVWAIAESFVDEAAFRAHQERTVASEWGRATSGIERHYAVEGLSC